MTTTQRGGTETQQSAGWLFLSKDFSKGHRATFFCATLLVIVSLALCAPLLWYGASDGADADSALMWMHGFTMQLSEGDLYPRWLTDMNRGAGSAVFYFYAPLPFYIGWFPATLLWHHSLNVQLAWLDWTLVLSSGVTFFACARRLVSDQRALFASALYMALPYHFETDLWVRQDLAELTNYIWMPLAFHFTDRIANRRDGGATAGLSGSYALMVLSHLPSTLIISICLTAYLLIRAAITRSVVPLTQFVLAASIGILMAGVYWIPAIFSQQYIHAEAWWTWYYDFHLWFFPVRPLDAFRGDTASRAFAARIFEVVCATTAIFVLLWLAASRHRSPNNGARLISSAVLVGTAWLLMTPLSTFVWDVFPPLSKVQFPSRLAMVVDLGTALVALYALPRNWRRDQLSTAATGMTLMLLTWCFASADLRSLLDPFNAPSAVSTRDDRVRNGIDPPEYTTRWSPFDPGSNDNSLYIAGMGKLTYDAMAGSIKLASWRPREVEFVVHLQRAVTITVRQFYFPNWRAKIIGGAPLTLAPNKENGLISTDLPAGNYRVSLELGSSFQEKLGYVASAVGLIMLGTLLTLNRHRRSESTHTPF